MVPWIPWNEVRILPLALSQRTNSPEYWPATNPASDRPSDEKNTAVTGPGCQGMVSRSLPAETSHNCTSPVSSSLLPPTARVVPSGEKDRER